MRRSLLGHPEDLEPAETSGRTRRCIAVGTVRSDAQLIRFVVGPDGAAVPDLAERLPGRGMWVTADREKLQRAIEKRLFSRAAKQTVTASSDLCDLVERLLAKRCLDHIGLANKCGALVTGFEKVNAAIRGGKLSILIEASDGQADGRSKLFRAAAGTDFPICVLGCFTGDELSLALGRQNVVHAGVIRGRHADRLVWDARRLSGFRSSAPVDWTFPGSLAPVAEDFPLPADS